MPPESIDAGTSNLRMPSDNQVSTKFCQHLYTHFRLALTLPNHGHVVRCNRDTTSTLKISYPNVSTTVKYVGRVVRCNKIPVPPSKYYTRLWLPWIDGGHLLRAVLKIDFNECTYFLQHLIFQMNQIHLHPQNIIP